MTPTPRAPRLLVGLGNPGSDYAKTRHNAGFWFCERLAETLGVRLKKESRFHGLVAQVRGDAHSDGFWMLLPQNFMNCSGLSVAALARFYRIEAADMLVVHDELDLPPGSLRLKFGGGLGGHNGLKDISAHLDTQDYWRLRIGIGHPGDRDAVVDYVLKPPRREEAELIGGALERAEAVWPWLARGDWPVAMQKLNAKTALPPSTDKTGKP